MKKENGVLSDKINLSDLMLLKFFPAKFWANVNEIDDGFFKNTKFTGKIKVPGSVKIVGDGSFENSKFKEIFLAEGIKTIKYRAFFNSNAETISLPNSLTFISLYAFSGCNNLVNIKLPSSLNHLGYGAFKNCKNLKEIELPGKISQVEDYTMHGCSNLKEVIIKDGILSIGGNAFSECCKLNEVKLPSTLKNIQMQAFANCIQLEEIVFPDGLDFIGCGAFENCYRLKKISIPNSVKTLNSSIFQGCTGLSEVKLPKGLQVIENSLFRGCKSLSSIELPPHVAEIKEFAFSGSGIKSIEIPAEVIKIDSKAFECCDDLSMVIFNSNVNIHPSAFDGCNFKYVYKIKGTNKTVLAKELPKDLEGVCEVISIDEVKKYFNPVDYAQLINLEIYKDILLPIQEKLKAAELFNFPSEFIFEIAKSENPKSFVSNLEFKYLYGGVDKSIVKDLLKKTSQYNIKAFYRFAHAIGCFSSKKLNDDEGRITKAIMGQKASSTLGNVLKDGLIFPNEFVKYFDKLNFTQNPSAGALNFISKVEEKKEYINFKLLLEMEKTHPQIFTKVLKNFELLELCRHDIIDNSPKKIPWKKALTKFYKQDTYENVNNENKDIAELFSNIGLDNGIFEATSIRRKVAIENGVPEHIAGTPITEETILESIEKLRKQSESELLDCKSAIDELYAKQFTYEWLSKRDPNNAILGLYCDCCAVLDSPHYGKHIAHNSIVSPNVQNLVIRNIKGEIIGKGALYLDKKTGYGIFNEFEISAKYRKSCRFGDSREEANISSTQRNLIFESIMRGVEAFVKEYDKANPNNPIKKINVGMGHNKLASECNRLKRETNLLTVPLEYGFEDIFPEQVTLYERNKQKDINKVDAKESGSSK